MLIVCFIGILLTAPEFKMPAFVGWDSSNIGHDIDLIPMLFVTVACGACSGFHALVSSGHNFKTIG